MATGIALCYYEKSGAGVTGLTVTTTVYQVALADLTKSTLVNAQTMTEIGGGLYAYRLASLDFSLYWYPFTTNTAGSVDTATLAGLVHDFGRIELAAYGASTLAQSDILSDSTAFPGANIDAAISTRGTANAGDAMALTSGERTTLSGVIWGYTERTLTSLTALVSSIAAAVWGYATRVLTSSSTAPGTGLTAETWRVIRGDALDRTFSTIAADASITKVQLTVKERPITEADAESILLVDSVTGLVYLNKTAPDSAYTATFTTAGVLAVTAATMAQVAPGRVYYDVQVWRGAATQTIETGTFVVALDVGRSTTAA